MHRSTSRTYGYISCFDEPSFFQNVNLILENIIQAFFFVIIKSADAPTYA